MEFWLLILVLCHATNSIESVNSQQNNIKLYKTFDEIFGEGWDNEEKPKLSEPNESQRMEASSTDNRHENSHQNGPNESEKSWDRNDRSEIDLNQVPVELVDSNPLNDLENENPYTKSKKVKRHSDERKREIAQEYIALKNKFIQEKKHSQNEWNQFSANVSKELGVSHGTVFKWKNQFGLNKKWHSDEQKQEKLKEYYEIKLRNPKIKDPDIAAALEISLTTLKYWKLQFKHLPKLNMANPSSTKSYSDDQKREIVQQYIALKNKFMQQKKHSQNEWNQFNANVSKELGVSHKTISTWKKQFFGLNINKIKKYTDEQKQEKMKEYYEIKLRNLKINDTDIAAALEISARTLNRWKLQFKHVPELNVPKSNGPPPV